MLDLFSFHMEEEEGEGKITLHTSQEISNKFLKRNIVVQNFL